MADTDHPLKRLIALAAADFAVWLFDQPVQQVTTRQRKRSRWPIETLFRDTKQYVALQACQCWCNQAFVRHIALVLLTFVVLQCLRQRPDECVSQGNSCDLQMT